MVTNINNLMYDILSGLTQLSGVSIYSMILPLNTPCPAIVYKQTDNTPEYTKDYLFHSIVTEDFAIITDKYTDALYYLNFLVNFFQNFSDNNFINCRIVNISEEIFDIENNIFIEQFSIKIKLKN